MVDTDFDFGGDEWFYEECMNIISVFIRISIQTAEIKIRLADRAYIGEA